MRKSLNIKGVGEVNLTKPRSFAAISDLNVDWWAAQSGGSHSTLSRLVAAAIGISWDHHRNELIYFQRRQRWRQPPTAFRKKTGWLDLVALQIARAWGREPDWFHHLPTAQQVQLLAMHRIENTPAKELQKKKKQSKEAQMRAAIQRYSQRDQHG
mgnify:CR=1 FL=1